MIKQSWACHTTRDQESDDEPLESLCIMYCMYVCPGKRQKEGYIRRNMQNPSGWYHGDCLTKRD